MRVSYQGVYLLRRLSQRDISHTKQLLLGDLPITVLLNPPHVLVISHLVIIHRYKHTTAYQY